MKLKLKDGTTYEVIRYEETWADSIVSRTMTFSEENQPEELKTAFTDEALSSVSLERAGKTISLPALTLQAINKILSEDSESIAGVFNEKK